MKRKKREPPPRGLSPQSGRIDGRRRKCKRRGMGPSTGPSTQVLPDYGTTHARGGFRAPLKSAASSLPPETKGAGQALRQATKSSIAVLSPRLEQQTVRRAESRCAIFCLEPTSCVRWEFNQPGSNVRAKSELEYDDSFKLFAGQEFVEFKSRRHVPQFNGCEETVVSSVFRRINCRSHGFAGGRKYVANVGSTWGTNTTIRRPPTVVNLYSLFSDPNCGRWIPPLFRRKSSPSWRTMQPPRVWELSNSRRCVVRESIRGSF